MTPPTPTVFAGIDVGKAKLDACQGKGQVSAFRVARGPDVGSGATGAGPPR